jgi:hypothetical protein
MDNKKSISTGNSKRFTTINNYVNGNKKQTLNVFFTVSNFKDLYSKWYLLSKQEKKRFINEVYDNHGRRRYAIFVKCGDVEKSFEVGEDDRLYEIYPEGKDERFEKIAKIPYERLLTFL